MPEDHDADGQEDDLPDDGLGNVPGRKRIAELAMLASLYVQVLGPQGTSKASATGFVLRGADRIAYLITNRHVVTGQNSLNGLKVPDSSLAISALRVAMHKAGRLGTWLPVAMRLARGALQPCTRTGAACRPRQEWSSGRAPSGEH